MLEEFNVITPSGSTEGGQEVPDEVYNAIALVAANMSEIIEVANALDEDGNLSGVSTDGNNAIIQLRRDTAANFAAANPILANGEMAWETDSSTPLVIKIGNGSTVYSALPNMLTQTTAEDFTELVDQAVAASESAQSSSETATTKSIEALDASADAVAAAELAQDWASAPSTASLPGGKKSAAVEADRAASTAAASRYIDTVIITADETFTPGMLFTKRRCQNASAITVTVPADVFVDSANKEAWAVYRKEGAGHVNFQGAATGGSVAPVLHGQGHFAYRNKTNVAGANTTASWVMPVPTIAAGRLAMAVTVIYADTLAPKTVGVTLNGGLVATNRYVLSQNSTYGVSFSWWEAPLTAFTAASITAAVTVANNVHIIQMDWWAMENALALAQVQHGFGTDNVTAGCTLTGITDKSLLLCAGGVRGNSSTVSVGSLSSNLTLNASGNTAGEPDVTTNDAHQFKNAAWARGNGVNNGGGDMTFNINVTGNLDKPGLVVAAYPPAAGGGGSPVTLNAQGTRTILNVLNAEAELYFRPNGRDLYLKIPSA
jgi:hypothetical protein